MIVQKGMVQIQVLQPNNTWRGIKNVSEEPFYYIPQMKKIKEQHPNARVRVVNFEGRLMDLMC